MLRNPRAHLGRRRVCSATAASVASECSLPDQSVFIHTADAPRGSARYALAPTDPSRTRKELPATHRTSPLLVYEITCSDRCRSRPASPRSATTRPCAARRPHRIRAGGSARPAPDQSLFRTERLLRPRRIRITPRQAGQERRGSRATGRPSAQYCMVYAARFREVQHAYRTTIERYAAPMPAPTRTIYPDRHMHDRARDWQGGGT